ncbi:MAG: hypothetical protein M3P06_08275 [Acidobacteriota bacterium]|nr:hypothetical protein [Acidobacteriota bacterium]
MSKVVTAQYDATENTLRLAESLDDVLHRATVQVLVVANGDERGKVESSSMELNGILSEEAGEELSRLVNEMFPPWN